MCFYYPSEVRSMKYCRLKVFREEYFMLLSSKYAGHEIRRKKAVIILYLKHVKKIEILGMYSGYIVSNFISLALEK